MGYDPLFALAINRLPGHNGWLKYKVLKTLSDPKDLPVGIAEYAAQRSSRSKSPLPNADRVLYEAEAELRRLRSSSIGFFVLGDEGYPAPLTLISDPPLLIYHRGSPNFVAKSAIAIVGTRRPSAPALRQAFYMGLEFALNDYPVVSGLAFGVDRAVHEGALAAEGPTWAVLASGLDRPSPYSHRSLALRILEKGGALIGEIPPGEYPGRYAFPRRNRILSGLCRGCIIVQAPQKSGALITAHYALDQNRDLYVASSGLEGIATAGSAELAVQGAPIVYSAADVLADWGCSLDISRIRRVEAPQGGEDLARMMKKELDGRLFRYMGGWFERKSA